MNRVSAAILSRIIVFFCVLFITCHADAAESKSRQKRVIGGSELDAGMFPWLAHLSATVPTHYLFGIPVAFEEYNCGGSILNDQWLLTAAHCFSVPDAAEGIGNPANWIITVGEVDSEMSLEDEFRDWLGIFLEEPSLRVWKVRAEAIIIHPQYDPIDTWENDVALVRVAEPLPVGPEHPGIAKVLLPSPQLGGSVRHSSRWPGHQNCVMKGWGCTSAGGPVESRARGVVMPIVPNGVCPFKPVGDNRLCAGYDRLDVWSQFLFPRHIEVGICPGDSGGPLVCQYRGEWLQAGIASYTSAHVPGRVPGVFTRVSYYVDWIQRSVVEYERNLN